MILLATAGLALAALTGGARRAREARRVAAARLPDRSSLEQPQLHREDLGTYQALLDESLQLAFPGSDPICAQAATRCGQPSTTPGNASDWQLHRGSSEEAACGPH
ncbi:MAG TPA: hypothetical protein VIP05_29945 [Burkholderiaceae bacterium]